MATNDRPVLVTGAAGFIGSHLARRLVRDSERVAVLVKKDTNTRRIADILLSPQVTLVYDDLSDAEILSKKLHDLNPRGVFHTAAALVHAGTGPTEDALFRANPLGTAHLITALADIDYDFFVNTGSFLEYGTHKQPLRESDLCEPTEAYSVSKLAATVYCQAIARSARKPIVTLRIFSPYGPDMDPKRLFAEIVRRAMRNEEIVLSQPSTSRDFIFSEDIVDLFLEAAEKAVPLTGEVFNLGSGHATTFKDLVERVLRLMDSKSVPQWGAVKNVVYDAGAMDANMEKTFAAFSWRPKRDLDFGIHQVAEWLSKLQ